MFHPAERARRPDADIKPTQISEAEEAAAMRVFPGGEQRIRDAAAALVQASEAPSFRLPMLPAVAMEVMAMASDLATPMNRIERAISRDTVLAARVLTVASSPAFTMRPIRTLTAALQLLGTSAVRDVIYQSVTECHVFRGLDEARARSLQERSLAVARLAKAVCKVAGVDQSQAFVCGLLHDIGEIALLKLDGHPALTGCSPAEGNRVREVVHTTLGARMGAKWRLPELVLEAIRRHHRFRDWEPGAYSQIGHIVAVADIVCRHLGIGGSPRAMAEHEVEVVGELKLDPTNLVDVAQRAFAGGV